MRLHDGFPAAWGFVKTADLDETSMTPAESPITITANERV